MVASILHFPAILQDVSTDDNSLQYGLFDFHHTDQDRRRDGRSAIIPSPTDRAD
jgi:hypothetical protein